MHVNPKYPLFLFIVACLFGFQSCSTQGDLEAIKEPSATQAMEKHIKEMERFNNL